MDAFHAAAWALVAYIAIAIVGGCAGLVGLFVIRRRAIREFDSASRDFERRKAEIQNGTRPHRGRFKL